MKKLLIVFLLFWSGVAFANDGELRRALKAYNAENYVEASRIWEILAEKGDAEAQNNLGFLFDEGIGVPIDNEKALNLYKKAAEQGLAAAQNNLGLFYEEGQWGIRDYKKAENWYEKAAKQGLAPAQYNLGLLYEKGQGGVSQDNLRAYLWFNIAEMNGDEHGKEAVSIIEKKLAPKQIEILKLHSNKCVKSRYVACGTLPASLRF